jgi:cAMP phosphodiesterase
MKDGHQYATQTRRKSAIEGPAIQVICLVSLSCRCPSGSLRAHWRVLTSQGAGGGPCENDVTGLLVRSTASRWSKGSILAVDAGSHLASIVSILQRHFPLVAEKRAHVLPVRSALAPASYDGMDVSASSTEGRSSSPEDFTTTLHEGPFAGLEFPFLSARANAVHVVRELVSTYLITHPHLDHLCGFVVNTAAFHNTSRPKRLAALPFTVDAIKEHIFNDRIWPNLTDEANGVGFVTFQRLAEGGNLALGDGESRGYIEVCDGLAVKAFKVSHGSCASATPPSTALPDPVARRNSLPPLDSPWHAPPITYSLSQGAGPPKLSDAVARRTNTLASASVGVPSQPGTPTLYAMSTVSVSAPPAAESHRPVVDSTAYFIRAEPSGRELLVFGDVEPDCLSAVPRNHVVWGEAAPRIATGQLAAVFIECSYTDAQPDRVLFGHMAPRHVVAELAGLADMVAETRRAAAAERAEMRAERASVSSAVQSVAAGSAERKRKRTSLGGAGPVPVAAPAPARAPTARSAPDLLDHAVSSPAGFVASATTAAPAMKRADHPEMDDPFSISASATGAAAVVAAAASSSAWPSDGPLRGLKVIIIHVKDDLVDGPPVGVTILAELRAHAAQLAAAGRPLGCEFIVSRSGESYWI